MHIQAIKRLYNFLKLLRRNSNCSTLQKPIVVLLLVLKSVLLLWSGYAFAQPPTTSARAQSQQPQSATSVRTLSGRSISQAPLASTSKPVNSNIVINNYLPETPRSPWWKDFLTLFAAIVATCGAITAATIARRGVERTRESNELQAHRKEIAEHFFDIQDRLATSNQVIKANASLQLAQFAEIRTINHAGSRSFKKTFDAADYVFFPPAASLLATAVFMEDNQSIRTAVKEALIKLAKFSNNGDGSLLRQLTERLAEANRFTKRQFIIALSEYSTCADITNDSTLHFIATLAPFCPLLPINGSQDQPTIVCLQSFINRDDFSTHHTVYAAKRDHLKKTEADQEFNGALLEQLELRATQLIDARDMLAYCLRLRAERAYSSPRVESTLRKNLIHTTKMHEPAPEMASHHTSHEGFAVTQQQPTGVRSRFAGIFPSTCKATISDSLKMVPLDLTECFLAGAELSQSNLSGVILMKADLQGAALNGTHLHHADMQEARLEFADMSGVHASRVILRRAKLVNSRLQNAQLESADLRDADIRSAHFTSANLSAALIGGAKVRQASSSDPLELQTDFSHTNWKEADYRLLVTSLVDEPLLKWLEESFPESSSAN